MFKNLKNLFIVEEEDSGSKNSKNQPKKTADKNVKEADKNTEPTPPPTPPTEPQNAEGKVNQKFLDILFGALEKNNLDGLDYLEFKQSLQALSSMPMDEATRYKSAFAMAQSMGASPEHLVNTARHYLDILSKEEKKFGQALEHQTKSKVGQQQMEIKSMEEEVTAKANQIKKLTQEIEATQKKIKTKSNAISNALNKINQTKSDFEASYTMLKGQIESDIVNMQKFLGGNTAKDEKK